eukprot:m.135270 g.135270  ORF g.135270 m.135270 type:complete len:544 (+) comp29785_c0_seq1:190-1821(+)
MSVPRQRQRSLLFVALALVVVVSIIEFSQTSCHCDGRGDDTNVATRSEQLKGCVSREAIFAKRTSDLDKENAWLKRVKDDNAKEIRDLKAQIAGLLKGGGDLPPQHAEQGREPGRPAAVAAGTHKYVTYERNFGRLNNQLITVAAAFEVAKMLNRTVFVQSEIEKFESNCVGCANMLIGMEDGLWDLEHMRKKYDVLLHPEVIAQYGSLDKHPVLGKGAPQLTRCVAPEWPAPQLSKAKILEMAADCDVINIGGLKGPVVIKNMEYEIGFFSVFRPAKYITSAADHFLKSIDWMTTSGLPRIAVHSRIFWEGRRCDYGFKFCSDKVMAEMHRQTATKSLSNVKNAGDVARQMCYPTPTNLKLILNHAGFSDISIKPNCGLGDKCQPWLLTSDSESGGILETMNRDHGARIFNINDYRESKNPSLPLKGSNTIDDSKRFAELRKLESSFADLYLLSQSEILLGNVYSTFTATVCKARGRTRANDSNVCGTLTGGPIDHFFTSAEAVGLPSTWKQHWQEQENKHLYDTLCKKEFDADAQGITLKF